MPKNTAYYIDLVFLGIVGVLEKKIKIFLHVSLAENLFELSLRLFLSLYNWNSPIHVHTFINYSGRSELFSSTTKERFDSIY